MSDPTAAIAELEVLRAQIAAQLQQIAERDQRIASQQRQIQNLDLTVQHLSEEGGQVHFSLELGRLQKQEQ